MSEPVKALPLPLSTRPPAGGGSHIPNIIDARARIFASDAVKVNPHLKSTLLGGGVMPRSAAASSIRPPSPRYLQATAASSAKSARGEGADPSTVDVSDMDAAGGVANDAMKTQIDFEQATSRRTLRQSPHVPRRNVPATTASIASPARGATIESPRDLAFSRLLEGGYFPEVSSGMAAGERPGP